ncbi:MAG: OmpA/MotB family protein [Alphaproteobacteria bacterium]
MALHDNKRQRSTGGDDGDEWVVTFSDTITLLLAFFVMLFSVSKIDQPVFEQVQAGLARDLGRRTAVPPITILESQLEAIVDSLGVADAVIVGRDDAGLILEFAAAAFYRPGTAEIRPEARPVIQNIARALLTPRNSRYDIEVEGHTDDIPVITPIFPSNWELSAARASRVVRLMIDQGVPPWRLRALGFADTKPKRPNRDAVGNPIPENQSLNQRLVLRIHR